MFEHIVKFEMGYDCIKFECMFDDDSCIPGKGGSHGRHGMSIRFVCKGVDGAVLFLLGTDWLPQFVNKSNIGYRHVKEWGSHTCYPAGLGYHSKKPKYNEHKPIHDSCEYCDGQPCYHDGSTLNANDAMYALVNGGENALWTFLELYYMHVFHGTEYPEPAEYPKPLRK